MSFPANTPTGYNVNGKDLGQIFKALLPGATPVADISYNVTTTVNNVPITYNLSKIFQPYSNNQAAPTNFYYTDGANLKDLNTLYDAINDTSTIVDTNPWTTAQTGYVYEIHNATNTFLIFDAEANSADTVHFILIGGGGGGAAGYTYEGGGGGGGVITFDISANQISGSYNLQIGAGGKGGLDYIGGNPGQNGFSGFPSSITGNNINLTAPGGQGGVYFSQNSGNIIGGAGGIPNGGYGGGVINSSPNPPTITSGLGNNGPFITFQDGGTPSSAYIGGAGGGMGGRYSGPLVIPDSYLGGYYGGGTGYGGIVNGDYGH